MKKLAVAGAFVATVYAANWALKRWGTVPVGFGLEAPAGVYFAGLGFLLRDRLNEIASRRWVIGAIITGAALSFSLGANVTIPGGHVSIAVASGAAFLFSELCDYAAYAPLRERTLPGAVAVSQVVGAVVDSMLFLTLAFGSLALLGGQIWGKLLVSFPVVAYLLARPRLQRRPA